VSPKLKLKRVETRIHKIEIWRSPFQWHFLGRTVFLKFLGTRLTLSNGQRKQSFNQFNKSIDFSKSVSLMRDEVKERVAVFEQQMMMNRKWWPNSTNVEKLKEEQISNNFLWPFFKVLRSYKNVTYIRSIIRSNF